MQGSYQKLVYDDEQPGKSEVILGISCSHETISCCLCFRFVDPAECEYSIVLLECPILFYYLSHQNVIVMVAT